MFHQPKAFKNVVEIEVPAGKSTDIVLGREQGKVHVPVPFLRPPEQKARGMPDFVSRVHGVLRVDNKGEHPEMQFIDKSTHGTGIGGLGIDDTRVLEGNLIRGDSHPIRHGHHIIFGTSVGLGSVPEGKPPNVAYLNYKTKHTDELRPGWFVRLKEGDKHKRVFLPHVRVTVHEKR